VGKPIPVSGILLHRSDDSRSHGIRIQGIVGEMLNAFAIKEISSIGGAKPHQSAVILIRLDDGQAGNAGVGVAIVSEAWKNGLSI